MSDLGHVTPTRTRGVVQSWPGFIGSFQWLAVSALSLAGVGSKVAIAFSLLIQTIRFIPTTIVSGVMAVREVS